MSNIAHALQRRRSGVIMAGGLLLLVMAATIMLSIYSGRADIGVVTIVKIMLGKAASQDALFANLKPSSVAIVWDIRLPRILIAALVGSGLAVSGAVFQALLLNPLADSYTIGVSTGAAFGAVVSIYLTLFFTDQALPTMPFAFAGALLTLLLVIKIATRGGYMSSSNLVIAGIIVSSILSAGISFLKNASGEQVSAIIYWLMGNLAARTWSHVAVSTPLIALGTLVCTYFAGDLNILCLGEQEARSLGVNTQKVRRIYLVTASLLTAVCVSVSGIIGFIGLIVPHVLRFWLTSDNRALIPLSALLGGTLLLLADNASRVFFEVEIPVGVITTLLGGPFFIYLFITRNKAIQ